MCHGHFDLDDATVVCKQIGYPKGKEVRHGAYYGPGSGTIWLDDVECSGREISLLHCSHGGIGVHNCTHSEDVGIVCQGMIGVMHLNGPVCLI